MYNPVHKLKRYIHVFNLRKRPWSDTHKSSVFVFVNGRRGLVRGELLIVVMFACAVNKLGRERVMIERRSMIFFTSNAVADSADAVSHRIYHT